MPPKRGIAKKPRTVRRVSASARRSSGQKFKGLFSGKELAEMNRPLLSTKSEAATYSMLSNKMRPGQKGVKASDQSFVLEYSKAQILSIEKIVGKVHARIYLVMQKLRDNMKSAPTSYTAKKTLVDLDLGNKLNEDLNEIAQRSMMAFTYAELNSMKKDIVGFLNKPEKVAKLAAVKQSLDSGIYQFFTQKKTTLNGGKPSTSSSSSSSDSGAIFDTDMIQLEAPPSGNSNNSTNNPQRGQFV